METSDHSSGSLETKKGDNHVALFIFHFARTERRGIPRHYFVLRTNNSSIMPYALASSAIIQ